MIELEKELISRNIPESAAFKEAIAHLAAVIDYIDNTQLDARTNILLDIELLKARRQLFVQMRMPSVDFPSLPVRPRCS